MQNFNFRRRTQFIVAMGGAAMAAIAPIAASNATRADGATMVAQAEKPPGHGEKAMIGFNGDCGADQIPALLIVPGSEGDRNSRIVIGKSEAL